MTDHDLDHARQHAHEPHTFVGPDSYGGCLVCGLGVAHQRHTTAFKRHDRVVVTEPWDRPAITITAYARNPASGRYVHPEQHRGLSVREAALLQSFPDDYQFAGSLDERFRQIGNAVPPAFAAHLASHVLRELHSEEPLESFDEGITKPVGPSFSRLIPALKAGHRKEFGSCDA